jgi:hypothetical protein
MFQIWNEKTNFWDSMSFKSDFDYSQVMASIQDVWIWCDILSKKYRDEDEEEYYLKKIKGAYENLKNNESNLMAIRCNF